MKNVRHIIIVCLVALFALGSLAHAANATTMAFDMAMADVPLDGGGDCQACPDNDSKSPLCDFVCLMTYLTLPTSFSIEPMTMHIAFDDAPDQDWPGRFGTPDPTPPRSSIQN
jgi:hypothetical protein